MVGDTITEKRAKPVLYAKYLGNARLVIFNGTHECDYPAAVNWLSQWQRATVPVVLSEFSAE